MPIEKKPRTLVPPEFVPPNSRRYKVKDGDSWGSLAKTHKVPVWDLIFANFKTRKPAEVNWYLNHYVGCNLPTADGKDWRFSNSANPGIVHIPKGNKGIKIEADANQVKKTGDFVPSNLRARGKRHFVSPKVNRSVSKFASLFKLQSMSPFVELNASQSDGFAASFEWEGATPVATAPHKARVSRMTPGLHKVKIKNKSDGKVVDELFVWIVWTVGRATDAATNISDDGTFLIVSMGYNFLHDIKPSSIITAADRPDLTGANRTSPPPVGGLNYRGNSLSGGVNRKWDSSRQVRTKTSNPSGVALPGHASFHGNFHRFPSATDGDGRPGGAGAVSWRNAMIAGNDDAGTGDEDNDPYTAPQAGKLVGFDTPTRLMRHADGSNGDTVEWRLHFLEFARLEINGTWFLISDYLPWRVHYKVKRIGGKWRNNGSSKARNNTGF